MSELDELKRKCAALEIDVEKLTAHKAVNDWGIKIMAGLEALGRASVGGIHLESKSQGPSGADDDPPWRLLVYERNEVGCSVYDGDTAATVLTEALKASKA